MNTYFAQRLRLLRKERGLTQEGLAALLNIKRSIIGAYEEGRAEPSLTRIKEIADFFSVSIDNLVINNNGSTVHNNLRLIPVVSQKAAAGYTPGHIDTDEGNLQQFVYVPQFQLDKKELLGFEISGDSMLPVQDGSIVIVEKVNEVAQIQFNKTYVIYTEEDGLVYKRILENKEDLDQFIAKSDNLDYSPYSVRKTAILELWKARYVLSNLA